MESFKIWKTISLGLHQTCSEYRAALRPHAIGYDGTPDYLTNQQIDNSEFPIHKSGTTIDLVLLTPRFFYRDSDTIGWWRYSTLFERAREKKLELCPPETPYALCLSESGQSKRLSVIVATEPFKFYEGRLSLLGVSYHADGRRTLFETAGWHHSTPISKDSEIAFCLPRK